MRKRLLDIFIVFYLIFGWMFLFYGITTPFISNVSADKNDNNY